MATVVTFNIAGTHATWESQAAGSNLVFAADKEDTGTERTVDEQSEYAGEVWGNSVDTAFDQINEVFNGTRTIQAFAVGGAVVGDAQANADDFVIGTTAGSDHGLTILGDVAHLYFGDAADNNAGRVDYFHSSDEFLFYMGGTLSWRFRAGSVRPQTDNSGTIGEAAARPATVYAYDGDFSGDVTVGGDLTVGDDLTLDSGAAILTLGDGTAAPTMRMLKSTAGQAPTMLVYEGSAVSANLRWQQRIDGTTQNISWLRYNGSGSLQDTPFSIDWSTGDATFANDVTLSGGDLTLDTGFLNVSVQGAVTASTTQTQGQQPLVEALTEVTTVANANDVVTLMSASGGRMCVVVNSGANTLQIFPASGQNLGQGTDTSTTLAAGQAAVFMAVASIRWAQIV